MKQLSSKQQKGLSYSECGKLGAIASAPYQRRRRQNNIKAYNKNPIKCKHCSLVIPYDKRRHKFCSHSCAAAFNNKGVRRHGEAPKPCTHCGKIVGNSANTFCSIMCSKYKAITIRYEKMKTENLNICSGTIRSTLLYIRGHQCEMCKRTKWKNEPIPVVMDHIDGHSNNNKADNLRVICCNCDALLPTYKSKNSDRAYRRERYKLGKSY